MLKSFLFAAGLFLATSVFSQTTCPPFWNDIQAFGKKDSAQMPPKNAILFVGSSSFTKWTDVQDYFPGYTIINRGFGGSTLKDVIRYTYDVILPYAPKQVVVYCGENDLAGDPTLTGADVAQRFETLFWMIRQNLPTATIDFISLKPSPSRAALFPAFRKANALIRAFLQKQTRAHFIDVYGPMLDSSGSPRKEIFVEDRLHMNATGYKIWQRVLLPYLKK